MKTYINTRSSREGGNALLMVLLLAVITLPILWGMLDVNVKTQHRSVARSQNWNGVLPLVEAGVEEGLAHLNRNCYSNALNGGNVQWFGLDGWTELSDGEYQATRKQLGSSYYDLLISTNAPASAEKPEIICTAYSPTLFGKLGLIPLYAAIGQDANVPMLGRRVRVSTAKYNLFFFAVGAKGNIRFNGQGGVDSFDSQDPSNSFYGLYDPRYRSDEAPIGSTDGSIDLGAQGEVYGEGHTSPNGTLTNGTIGSEEWVDGGNSGTEEGSYQNDLNMNLLDVELPDGAESWPLLSLCDCFVTITNPVRAAKTLISPTYPSPPPPGGIISTNTMLVTTDYYPSPAPDSGVVTNKVEFNQVSHPSPYPPYGVRTNVGDNWVTDPFKADEPPLYGCPTVFVSPPGVTTNTKETTDKDIHPAAGTYAGVVITNDHPSLKVKGVRYTNYTYDAIQSYTYKAPISYTWTNDTFTYLTPTGYKYVGAVTNETIVTSRYKYVTTAGNWRMPSLSLSGQERMLIRAPGRTTLYITGAMDMGAQSQITIEYGASLVIYLAGNADLGGQGIMNDNDNALDFCLYGLNTCTNISISGNASLTGTIYAPYADIRANGGGNDSHDIIGAIVGKSVTFNGHFKLHYDKAVGRNGPSWGFVATRWIEEAVD